MDVKGKRLLSIKSTAEYLGMSFKTLYRRSAPKALDPFPVRPIRWGKRVSYDIQDLDRWIDSLKTVSNEKNETD